MSAQLDKLQKDKLAELAKKEQDKISKKFNVPLKKDEKEGN